MGEQLSSIWISLTDTDHMSTGLLWPPVMLGTRHQSTEGKGSFMQNITSACNLLA